MVLSEASWPMAISGYPRGHNVKWVTRCRSTQGQISLTDTPLEPNISEPDRSHRRETPQMERPLVRRCSNCLASQLLWVEAHSFLPHGQGNAGDLAGQCQTSHG